MAEMCEVVPLDRHHQFVRDLYCIEPELKEFYLHGKAGMHGLQRNRRTRTSYEVLVSGLRSAYRRDYAMSEHDALAALSSEQVDRYAVQWEFLDDPMLLREPVLCAQVAKDLRMGELTAAIAEVAERYKGSSLGGFWRAVERLTGYAKGSAYLMAKRWQILPEKFYGEYAKLQRADPNYKPCWARSR